MEKNVFELTHYYSDAFNARNLEIINSMFAENANQVEPGKELKGREEIMNHIRKMYNDNSTLNFYATRIIASQENLFSVIEFEVEVGNGDNLISLRGTDHISWNSNGEIEFLEAFVNPQ